MSTSHSIIIPHFQTLHMNYDVFNLYYIILDYNISCYNRIYHTMSYDIKLKPLLLYDMYTGSYHIISYNVIMYSMIIHSVVIIVICESCIIRYAAVLQYKNLFWFMICIRICMLIWI